MTPVGAWGDWGGRGGGAPRGPATGEREASAGTLRLRPRSVLPPPLLGKAPRCGEDAPGNEHVQEHALNGRRCPWGQRRRWLDVERLVPEWVVVCKRSGVDRWPDRPRWPGRWTRAFGLWMRA